MYISPARHHCARFDFTPVVTSKPMWMLGSGRVVRDIEGKIERLYGAVDEGNVGNTAMFRWSPSNVEAERDETLCVIAVMEMHREVPRHLPTTRNIERLARR